MRALATLTVLAALAAGPAPALADGVEPSQPVLDTAEAHYEQGRRFYDLKEYAAAISEFKRAYMLDPSAIYLFNIAQAYRLSGDCAAAGDFFARFLKAEPSSDQRGKIERLVAECKPAPGPAAPIDDRAPPDPHPPPPPDPGRWRRITGLLTAGAGVVMLGVATGLAIHVSGVESDLEAACATSCDWAAVRDRDASARRQETIATALAVGGGVAALAGVGLYLWGRHLRPEAPPVAIVPRGGGAVVTATFGF